MIVLHSLWDKSGKLGLWAESSYLPALASRPRGRQPKRPRPRLHPFALAEEGLREALRKLSQGLPWDNVAWQVMAILLPSTRNGPLPSPWLIREDPVEAPRATELLPWDVASLRIDPDLALDFLLSLSIIPPHGVGFGDSLRFWMEVAKYSLELIIKGQYAPTIREKMEDGKQSFQAGWEAVIGEGESEKVFHLTEAMPPVCRLLPGRSSLPSELLLDFLHRTVDAFVRRSLSRGSFFSPRKGHKLSLPERWIGALSSTNPTIKASDEEIFPILEEIRVWLSQVKPADSGAPFRTCFKLDPPVDDKEKGWRMSFWLQAKDDRSLLVPAEKVWRSRSRVVTFLKRRFENPQERLLADLGRASRLFPSIEESLQTPRPVELKMKTEKAYTFLRQSAPLLEDSGFGLLLPSWWHKRRNKIGIKLKLTLPKSSTGTSSGLLGLNGIVAYDWEVAIGEETLSPEEFEKLSSLKVPLVKVRGEWVELRREEIASAIAFFQKRHANGQMELGEAMRLGLGGQEPAVGLPVVEVVAEGRLEDLLHRLSDDVQLTPLKPPRTFQGKLRPYQVKGLSWLVFLKEFGLGACLADDMGLGKTIQLIALLLHERKNEKAKPGPTLLVCPMSVVGNWQREVERFAPSLRVMVHHGPTRFTGRNFKREAKKNDLVISTYALAYRDQETFSAVHWENIGLDEAQNIKNPSARQTQAVRKLKANHRIALTGTPVENRLSELWSIMEFLNPGYLRSAKDFSTNFALPIEKYHNPQRAQSLRRIIQPFVLRRLKTDPKIIKDLPEKMEIKVFCNLTSEQASLYEAVVKEMLGKIENSEGIERKGLVLATLMKLKQICNHPALFLQDGSILPGRSCKLRRLEEMLEEVIAEGDRALIFTQFSSMGGMLRHHLQERLGCETLFLHGGTPKRQRDNMVGRFQSEHRGPPLFILSLKAGGFGLNLTAANHVFHFDRWWNPAVENQATDRAFRIGQTRNVEVHKFVCIGTLEERIDQMIELKKELAEKIIGIGEGWLTELSTNQLRKVFTLSKEAVSD